MLKIGRDERPNRAQPEVARSDQSLAKKTPIGTPPYAVRIKRAYEVGAASDGRRVLVDRLWPRGLTKQDLADALWLRDVAPSAALRKWFDHKPERWAEFRVRYFNELRSNPTVETLRGLVAAGPVTLIYGARDTVHNQAVALAAYLGAAPPTTEEKR
jgi:uncharacterized protein YeaO (DUF488 family)